MPVGGVVDLVLRHDSRFRRPSEELDYIDDFGWLGRGESLVWAVDWPLAVLEWVGGRFLVIFEAGLQDRGFCPVRYSMQVRQFWMKLTLNWRNFGDVLEWLNDASKGDELGSFRSIEGFMVSFIMCGGDSFSGVCECSTGGEGLARNCELARR